MKKVNLLSIPFCFVLLFTVTQMSSCKKSSSNNDVTVNVAGNWQGALTGVKADEGGNTTIMLEQSGANLTGTFTIANSNGPVTGTLTGTVNGNNISLTLTATSAGGGGAILTGTINAAGNSMSGAFATSGTGGSGSGTWSLTKQ